MPYAPGTFGAAVGLGFIILFQPGESVLLLVIITIFWVGVITSEETEKVLGKDSQHIVIDEFCGYLLTVLFIPRKMTYLLAGFFLFRLFDILKPPPIRFLERKIPGGRGIMLDDVMAGLYANACLQVWRAMSG